MNLAYTNVSGDVFSLTEELLKKGIEGSRLSERKRVILPLHRTQEAKVQRMVNFLQPGTYLRPHMHANESASETVILLRGGLRFLIFSPDGHIMEKRELYAREVNCMIDIEPKVWHSFVVLEDDTVILEFKRGPYDAEGDKVFADWAPPEFTPEVVDYMATWL